MQMRRIKRHFIAVKVNKSSPYLIRAETRAALCVTWFEGDVQIKVGQAERPNLVPNNISMGHAIYRRLYQATRNCYCCHRCRRRKAYGGLTATER